MATSYALLLRHASMVAPKVVSSAFRFNALVDFACSKWYELNGKSFGFSYKIADVGKCVLKDEDDMKEMFLLASQMNVGRIEVAVEVKADEIGGPVVLFDDTMLEAFVRYDDPPVQVDDMQPAIDQPIGPNNMLSNQWTDLIGDEGQRFPGGSKTFKTALIKHAVQIGYEFKFLRNDLERVTAECRFREVAMCPWRIHATVSRSSGDFVIREYNKDHTCETYYASSTKNRFNTTVIIDLITDDIRNMPGISPKDVQTQVNDKFGVEISYYVAWRAIEVCRSRVFGDHTMSYSYLPSYIEAVEKSNPNSVFHLDIHPTRGVFERMFFAFGASLEGFKHCRPVLMVDGTFLKGKHRGVLLSAVGKDGNEGLFPIAFAIVSEENDRNWEYFFDHLKVAIGTTRDIIFVSDRQHGIIAAVKKVFPRSTHGFCYKHLTANLKHLFSGTAKTKREKILGLFARCAYVRTRAEFDVHFQELKEVGGTKITTWLEDIPKENWANAYFAGRRYGQMTSNGCESWNNQIRHIRALPITKLVDGIRVLFMQQMADRKQKASTWNSVLCKRGNILMKEYVQSSRSWVVRPASEDVYEVLSKPSAVVDLKGAACSCRMWQISGPPCAHAARVIFLRLNAAYEHVDHYYHTEAYVKSYSAPIIPFSLPPTDSIVDVVGPPDYQARRGRPKRKRIPSKGEHVAKKIKCSNCKRLGSHNKKSCTMTSNGD